MASRRNLKKNVNYISDLVTGLCVVENANAKEEKHEAIGQILLQIVRLRRDIISRISHTEPGNVKGFYKHLRNDFNSQIDNIFQKLEEISK